MRNYKVIPGSKFERQLKKLSKEIQSFIAEISEFQKITPFPQGYDLKKRMSVTSAGMNIMKKVEDNV